MQDYRLTSGSNHQKLDFDCVGGGVIRGQTKLFSTPNKTNSSLASSLKSIKATLVYLAIVDTAHRPIIGQRTSSLCPHHAPRIATMCQWYAHHYKCKHVTYALGKYCSSAALLQTPCKNKTIWQTIRMGVDCEECAGPENRRTEMAANPKGGN